MMESNYGNDNNYNDYYPIIMAKNSNYQLPLSSPSSLMNIAKWKDERLELIEIPKGLIEILQNAGFTIEKVLDCGPSHIAEILKIDDYMGELIYHETKKVTRNIISNSNF
jgi:hypothetical protein